MPSKMCSSRKEGTADWSRCMPKARASVPKPVAHFQMTAVLQLCALSDTSLSVPFSDSNYMQIFDHYRPQCRICSSHKGRVPDGP